MRRSRNLIALLVLLLGSLFLFVSSASAGHYNDGKSVVDVALEINAETGEFDTLIAAAVCTNLVKPLDRKQGITVFAPTDAAFAKLGLDEHNICDIPRKTLTNILLYHVAKGTLTSGDVVSMESIKMANRQYTTISVTDSGVFINESQIIAVDVMADNGVIHVIDAVLLP